MNWGCLSFLFLFPAGIFIWAAGERHRRDALPAEELKKIEDEEDHGDVDPELECIFCHSRNCVRTRKTTEHVGSPARILSEDNVRPTDILLSPARRLQRMALRERNRTADFLNAHCMNCSNDWEMFPPKTSGNQ